MFRGLVWLFPEYREALQRIVVLEHIISNLEKQLRLPPANIENMELALQDFNDTVLAEQPFPDNKVPEKFYLTPPEFSSAR